MFVEREPARLEATNQERRETAQTDTRILGRVVQCDGARATIAAYADNDDGSPTANWTVGRMVSINLNATRTVGLVYSINKPDHRWNDETRNAIEVGIELIGEVRDVDGRPVFDRGITIYPHIGAIAHRIRTRDLQAVYDLGGRQPVIIGNLSQDDKIDACVAIDDTLNRHFAVVGTTGVGKSTAVSLILRKAISARPSLRVLIMDPHNEFASSFPDQVVRIDGTSLDLPFWLFRLEEFAEVLYRGREVIPEELELLRELVPLAKQSFNGASGGVQLRRSSDGSGLTADTPVPYRIHDLLRLIDDRIGQLDSKSDRPFYRSLRTRLDSAINDPRYRFMFHSRLVDDTIHETIGHIFRIPHGGKPITCLEMAGMPPEVVNSVCSVLARLAFDVSMWSGGKLELLLLCEEAHRYMPADPRLGFAPTRHALSRIAKEGRKYGCYLGVVTQRPGDLDPTILSQCSTVFAMRLTNERDQDIIRSAIADSSASILSFLSSMGQREAIAFGEGVAATMRMKFEKLQLALIPGSSRDKGSPLSAQDTEGDVDLFDVVGRMRNIPRTAIPTEPIFPMGTEAKFPPSIPERERPQEPAVQSTSGLYGRRIYDKGPGLFRR